MDKTTLAILVTVTFSVIGVVGDYFLKLASERTVVRRNSRDPG